MRLSRVVKLLPTPTAKFNATPHANSHTGPDKQGAGGDNLKKQIGGALNPDWVDWLMGFPRGWTAQDGPDGLPVYERGIWDVEPDIPRLAKGVPNQGVRLKALGNAVVPQQAYLIFAAIVSCLEVLNNCEGMNGMDLSG